MKAINLIHVEPEFSLMDQLLGRDSEPAVQKALTAGWIFMLGSLLTTFYLVCRARGF